MLRKFAPFRAFLPLNPSSAIIMDFLKLTGCNLNDFVTSEGEPCKGMFFTEDWPYTKMRT